jgi:uncharacterized membrane protein YgaE (UPF0421/DUF939 family)
MNAALLTTWLGTIASLIGVLIAFAQTVRLRDLRRRTEADLWQIIGTMQRVMVEIGKGKSGSDVADIAREALRHLIKTATLAERPFTKQTIRSWIDDGKITTEWEIAQAKRFLATSRSPDYTVITVPDKAGKV